MAHRLFPCWFRYIQDLLPKGRRRGFSRSKCRCLAVEALEGRCLLRYALTDLGTLGGPDSMATALNNAGQVVGIANDGSSHTVPFLWQGGTTVELPAGPGYLGGLPRSINDGGAVVGYSSGPAGVQAVLFGTDGHGLGTADSYFSSADAVNAAGQVVGVLMAGDYGAHGFLWEAGALRDLGPGWAHGINAAGWVVGESAGRPFRYDEGTWVELPLPPGALGGSAQAINDAGQAAGSGLFREGGALVNHPLLWQGDGVVDLGVPCGAGAVAWAINRRGQVVGECGSDSGQRAFLWSAGWAEDLTGQVTGSGWLLEQALGINDAGQIVGMGRDPAGDTRAYLLTPEGKATPQDQAIAGEVAALAPGQLAVALGVSAGSLPLRPEASRQRINPIHISGMLPSPAGRETGGATEEAPGTTPTGHRGHGRWSTPASHGPNRRVLDLSSGVLEEGDEPA